MELNMNGRHALRSSDHFYLNTLGPEGFMLVMSFSRQGSEFSVGTYPAAWIEQYLKKRYMWVDPILIGSIMKNGTRRWSEIRLPDPFGVLKAASKHGMKYGVCLSRTSKVDQLPCLLSVSREDRELTDEEITGLDVWFDEFVDAFGYAPKLTEKETEALKLIAEGQTVDGAAHSVGISSSAIKNRLASSREKLGAKTNAHAVLLAADKRVL